METYKQMMDTLGGELLDVCKQKRDKQQMLEKADRLLQTGADVNFKGCRPIYFAVKNYNFSLIKLLINYGALESEISRKYLASACEKGGFSQKKENAFFDVLDYAIAKTGFDIVYLAPYINMTLVMGRTDKFFSVIQKYGLSIDDALLCVRQMIIFEIINFDRAESLRLIDTHLKWEQGAIDTAVASGQNKVVDYILNKNRKVVPSKESIVRAISAGHTEVLRILDFCGINLSDEIYIKAACRCLSHNSGPLQFLADKGVLKTGYDGKSLYENAMAEKNKPLLEFVKNMSISGL